MINWHQIYCLRSGFASKSGGKLKQFTVWKFGDLFQRLCAWKMLKFIKRVTIVRPVPRRYNYISFPATRRKWHSFSIHARFYRRAVPTQQDPLTSRWFPPGERSRRGHSNSDKLLFIWRFRMPLVVAVRAAQFWRLFAAPRCGEQKPKSVKSKPSGAEELVPPLESLSDSATRTYGDASSSAWKAYIRQVSVGN